MRVIGGSARRLQLKTIRGLNTRPTTDRIKETLFNMLMNDINDCVFLDLFSGSGAIGIEALSRGANSAVFVENNPEAVSCIKDNLNFTRLSDNAMVMNLNVLNAISILEREGKKFDIVFLDPPYDRDIERTVLDRMAYSDIIDENTLIIVEALLDTDFSYLGDMGYCIIKEKLYKTNKHVFMKKE